jgi:hypothetical protein
LCGHEALTRFALQCLGEPSVERWRTTWRDG